MAYMRSRLGWCASGGLGRGMLLGSIVFVPRWELLGSLPTVAPRLGRTGDAGRCSTEAGTAAAITFAPGRPIGPGWQLSLLTR